MMARVLALTIEYRNPLMTIACVEALLSEGVSHVLIIDNSDDGAVSAATLRDRFSAEARVELLESKENVGFAAGMNMGLSWLRDTGKIGPVLLVNNDAVLGVGSLQSMLDALEKAPGVSLVYPTLLHAGRPMGLTYYHRATGLLSQRSWPGSFPFVSGCCLLLSPELVARDLFDSVFFMYGEDVELSWRLAGQKIHASAAQNAIVAHLGSAASGIGSDFYEAHMVAGHIILAWKLSTGRLSLLTFLVCRGLTLTLRAAIRGVRFRSLTPISALGNGVSIACRALRGSGT
jgi:GT2 family glycosyltransferase